MGWSLIMVVFHQGGHTRVVSLRLVSQQGLLSGWSLIRTVPHQVVSQQSSLLSGLIGWSFVSSPLIRVISH